MCHTVRSFCLVDRSMFVFFGCMRDCCVDSCHRLFHTGPAKDVGALSVVRNVGFYVHTRAPRTLSTATLGRRCG